MFVRGGYVYPGYYYLNYAGDFGNYWSSVGRSSSGAYTLYFTSGLVYPSTDDTRYNGFFVRCVTLGG